ncbi:6-phosphogluconolactonase [Klebsiella pneumoniae]|nr:6-phosphogluconolactonase [Klebsiella pneumoniae]
MKQTVYTASPESQQIHVWSLEADGKLTLVQVVDAPGQVQPMVVSPTRNSVRWRSSGVSRAGLSHHARITGVNLAGEAALPAARPISLPITMAALSSAPPTIRAVSA